MLQFDAWKRVLIWATCVAGLLLALPNGFYTRVEMHNDAVAAIEIGAAWVRWFMVWILRFTSSCRWRMHFAHLDERGTTPAKAPPGVLTMMRYRAPQF